MLNQLILIGAVKTSDWIMKRLWEDIRYGRDKDIRI